MANPSFDDTALTTHGATEILGSPAARAYAETMPDVDGAFVQPHGRGARQIIVGGAYLGSAQATVALAISTLKTTLRTIQQKVGTRGTYVGADSASYTGCVLMSYQPGRPQVVPDGSNYKALVAIQAVVTDPTP